MQEINLLQQESESSKGFTFNFRRGGHVSFYVVVAILVLEVLVYLFVAFSRRQVDKQMLALQQREVTNDLEISKIDPDRQEAISAQARLKNLDILLASHLLWTKVFSELENNTYKPIRFESLQVDQVNTRFVISGFAVSETDIAKFMVGLKKSPYITNVNLRTAVAQQGEKSGYTFNMDANFDSKLLRR